MTPPADAERSHRAEAVPGWRESWTFEVADESVSALARLTVWPDGPAWFWAYLLRSGERVLAVREHDVPPPRGSSLEIRAEALWADFTCEEPFDHWSVGVEAFGVLLDEPEDALRGERGDRTGLGFDLGWEAAGPPVPQPDGYAVPARVHGEILTGVGATPEVAKVAGVGRWVHRWGPDRSTRTAEAPIGSRVWVPVDGGSPVLLRPGPDGWVETVGVPGE